uniref:Uncharacterized protein n=1 Tax=Chloroflexus aurantiacus TaxID=1108 RepID=Q9F6W6_CHLAU|nr:unknown [Chloroflexus aurantiacus]
MRLPVLLLQVSFNESSTLLWCASAGIPWSANILPHDNLPPLPNQSRRVLWAEARPEACKSRWSLAKASRQPLPPTPETLPHDLHASSGLKAPLPVAYALPTTIVWC